MDTFCAGVFLLHLGTMEAPLTPENVRALLARSGLTLPGDRLERLTAAVEVARKNGRPLAERDMGYQGPPAFQPPQPETRPDGRLPTGQAGAG